MKSFIFLSIVAIGALIGCKNAATTPSPTDSSLAFYQIRDSIMTAHQAWNTAYDSLELVSLPLLTIQDIKSYSWSTHSFVLQPGPDSVFKAMGRLGGKSSGVPFMVTIAKQPIYLGAFWWIYSSSLPEGTYILMPSDSPYRLSHPAQFATQPDKRGDQRIHDALSAAGVLVD